MALLTKTGYGQVEPNHLSAQRTGQIYAQLPAVGTITELENGTFVKYNYADGVVDFAGEGEWMLVYNEVKLYDKARQTYKDFRLETANAVGGKIYPRVFKTNVGDIFTTNLVELGATAWADVAVGTAFVVGATGILEVDTPVDGQMVWQLVKKYTLPDGQAAGKFMRLPDAVVADL